MDKEYTRQLEIIEAAIEKWLPKNPEKAWFQTVFPDICGEISQDSLEALLAPGKDLLCRGGKRWRPLLMTLVCQALGGGDASVPLAPLVELCHNASLIHDDIEDNSEQRRGLPAVHRIYGDDTAINSGSFLYFLPLSCIESWANELAEKGCDRAQEYKDVIYRLWAEHIRKLHLGQAMDIHWHRNFSLIPGIEEYYLMCGLKTGSLAGFAAKLGVHAACVAGAQIEQADKAIGQFGEAAKKLGIGFQILDDVKNLSTGIPGKKRGDDVVEGKKSLPVLLYLHNYQGKFDYQDKLDFVSRCFSAAKANGAGAPEVEEFIQALCASGALEEAKEKGLDLIAQAQKIFTAPDEIPNGAGFTISPQSSKLFDGFIRLIT